MKDALKVVFTQTSQNDLVLIWLITAGGHFEPLMSVNYLSESVSVIIQTGNRGQYGLILQMKFVNVCTVLFIDGNISFHNIEFTRI